MSEHEVLYTATYPKLAYAPGPKCGHRQYRRGRIPLDCVRPAGHAGNHLHDVPAEYRWRRVDVQA